jgi:tetratricopeptide (TPR) repeat protein
MPKSVIPDAISADTGLAGINYLEEIYGTMAQESIRETTHVVENDEKVENYLEKSVDSNENIDKMGIENIVQERENLTIDECIEEAFRLKGQGDTEGAILYYMYALDKNPQKELTFWIVLDICTMYKNLGQSELALDILNSYYEIFGNIMDASVRQEIESNLSNIQV